ncbi:MAG: peptidylprolyl isomerase [Candidatus Accumulibacter sp.]|nr:peptidylprolyl isomerase [Accumulibacter sp.]
MEKSGDAGSNKRGGDLGCFDGSRMVPEFSSAVSRLEKGAFTQEPVKTQYGYHVILLEDSRPIEAPHFEEVKADLARYLPQQNLKKQVDGLKARAGIELVQCAWGKRQVNLFAIIAPRRDCRAGRCRCCAPRSCRARLLC